jgi:hypothetical protein
VPGPLLGILALVAIVVVLFSELASNAAAVSGALAFGR